MTESATATIIPFPVRRSPELSGATLRLADSLTALSEALVEQREATQRWRNALLALSERLKTVGVAAG